ncbi:MAG: chromate transporter [Negativicutes bacterium]|nr:chromate transporter [Negativicutes bacterium]
MNNNLLSLLLLFGSLSLVSVGGGNTVIPDIHRETVLVRHWLSETEFAAAFAIAQAAPGPGSLLVALVGWKAAGWPGAVVATAAMYGPACVLTYFSCRLWLRFRDSSWRIAVEKGLAPVAIGLIFASGWVIAQEVSHGLLSYAFTAVAVWVVAKTGINPLILMVLAGLAGIAGLF